MVGELYAFSATFDIAFIIKRDLERFLRCKLSLLMFTNSKQMFDVVTCVSNTTRKRLMIYFAATRDTYCNFDISNVGLLAGTVNPADALNKPKLSSPLLNILLTGIDKTLIEQGIILKK